MQSIINYIKYPKRIVIGIIKRTHFLYSDSLYLRMRYRIEMKRKLNLKNPRTFNEKIQWLKIYDRNPFYTTLVDKVKVKEFVSKTIGEQYVIPTIGVWERFQDIDFDSLPERFVLKTNHSGGSTGVVICKDKASFDKEKASIKLKTSLQWDPYPLTKEWPYKNVPKRIFAEEYKVDDLTGELRDYKFFCFGGKVKALFIATDRQTPGEKVKFDFFDADFNHLPVKQGHENASVIPARPNNFDKMKELAEQLSQNIPHVRVDFYEANNKVYFGEMTFYHFSGIVPFVPEEWDYKFGELLSLPTKR